MVYCENENPGRRRPRPIRPSGVMIDVQTGASFGLSLTTDGGIVVTVTEGGRAAMPKVMSKKAFLALVQQFTAVQAVGTSAVRGQRSGTLGAIHAYLGRLRLDPLAGMDRIDYTRWLDVHTVRLQKKLRGRQMPWGIARKAMNLFMRSCLYNTYLSRAFHLARVQRHMEIPLDGAVARGLKRRAGRGKLPQWPGLSWLKADVSLQYQDQATTCVRSLGLPGRVFLDNYLWLENR